jgi:hypothetical protein
MRKAALDRLLGLVVIGACAACGASPAYEAKTPATVTVPTNEVMVVPADRVVEKCPCDGERSADGPTWAKPVQYVHVTEWQSPASAKRAEAFVAEDPSRFRASGPPPPALSMHQPIPETRIVRMGRSGWRY